MFQGLTQLAQCHTKIGVFVNLCHHILFLFCLDLVQDIQHSTGKHLSPVLESPHIGNVNNGMFFSRSLILRRNLVYSNGNILSSKSRVEGYLAKMQQELVEGTARELDEGTSELESKS
ncbi:ankyrin repeat domain-containing protein 26-like isoform X2 [Phascolarctos cinereus]